MTRSPKLVAWTLAVLFLAGLAASGEALTAEQVVQRFMRGTSATELIELIDSSEVDFDVSREMQDELRRAGLPANLIEAMVRRQREMEGGDTTAAEDELTPDLLVPTLTLELDRARKKTKDEKRPVIRIHAEIPLQTAKQLDLDPEVRSYEGLALFLACLTAEHVPDHWRGKSPLGRDFLSAPRHRMLAFHDRNPEGVESERSYRPSPLADRSIEAPEVQTVLMLEIPERLEATLEPGVAHDLLFGFAVLADGRYYLVSSDRMDEVQLDRNRSLAAEIELPKKVGSGTPKVRFVRKSGEPGE